MVSSTCGQTTAVFSNRAAHLKQPITSSKFDSELRKLIIAEIEKIEVAVRTQTAYILSQHDAYWFEDSSLF